MDRNNLGDKTLYKRLLGLAVPMMAQNAVTFFMALVDNIMISGLGTPQMSGVAIANQLLPIVTASAVGGVSGAGAYCAQQYGCRDSDGIRQTFRFRVWLCLSILTVSAVAIFGWSDSLISLYLHADEDPQALEQTLHFAKQYLLLVTLSLPAYFADQIYANTLRDCGEAVVPMAACLTAIFLNLILDALLIRGRLGFPALGVAGAAIATIVARYVQAAIVMVWAHTHTDRMPFFRGLFRGVRISRPMAGKYIIACVPLLFNEGIYAAGQAVVTQCYSLTGLYTVAAINISTSMANILQQIIFAFASAVAILTGQRLGMGELKKAREENTGMVAALLGVGLLLCASHLLLGPALVGLFRAETEVQLLAKRIVRIAAITMPLCAAINVTYHTLRAGGRNLIVMAYDCVPMWGLSVPLAFFLSRFTALSIVPLYFLSYWLADFIKSVLGLWMVRRGIWLRNLTNQPITGAPLPEQSKTADEVVSQRKEGQ